MCGHVINAKDFFIKLPSFLCNNCDRSKNHAGLMNNKIRLSPNKIRVEKVLQDVKLGVKNKNKRWLQTQCYQLQVDVF